MWNDTKQNKRISIEQQNCLKKVQNNNNNENRQNAAEPESEWKKITATTKLVH